MARSKSCPHCGHFTLHEYCGYDECSRCGYISLSLHRPIRAATQGKGEKCPNCFRHTFHRVKGLPHGETIRRCSTCSYSAILPPASEAAVCV